MTKISALVSFFLTRNLLKLQKINYFSSFSNDHCYLNHKKADSTPRPRSRSRSRSRSICSEAEEKSHARHAASVYAHWPYCEKRCTYCNFNKYIESNVDHRRMENCFERETKTLLELSGVQDVPSVFFGGGTPSLALPSTISSILDTISSTVGCQGQREVTLEVNPTGFETDKLKDFQASGVNRVSIEIQTLDPNGLAVLGRLHSASDSLRCLERANRLFQGKVSIDLIFGWPGQTLECWLEELCYILPLCGNHVSLYQLTLERGTRLFTLVEKGLVKTVQEDERDDMYIQGKELLSKHGYERYEVSNFAKQDNYSFHNLRYWSGHQYIGVGPGAHGRFRPIGESLREARVQTLEPNNWMFEVEKFGHATRLVRPLSPLEQLEELLISGLRTRWGIRHQAWSAISKDVALHEVLLRSADVKSHVDRDLLAVNSKRICATDQGINVLDSLLPDLLLALQNAWNG